MGFVALLLTKTKNTISSTKCEQRMSARKKSKCAKNKQKTYTYTYTYLSSTASATVKLPKIYKFNAKTHSNMLTLCVFQNF